jgi:hypothetical protein
MTPLFIFLFGGGAAAAEPTFSKFTFSSVSFSTRDEDPVSLPTFSRFTFSSVTFSTKAEEGGAVVVPIKPPGGDDAPGHPGIQPRLIKDKSHKRKKQIERDELEELYNRIQGIEPQTKAAKKAIAAVQKAVAPSAIELPPTSTLDWVSLEADLRAAIAIRKAYEIIQDEEDALIALLLAA